MARKQFSQWRKERSPVLPVKQILCIVLGLLLGAGAEAAARMEQPLNDGYILERKGYGQGEVAYELIVKGLKDEPVLLGVELGERVYTRKEAHQMYERILEELPSYILGENTSLQEVRKDLNLITSLSDYGVRLR